MTILALDVDGVLLDPDRGGKGHWSAEVERQHGITGDQLVEAFFAPLWQDIVTGRRPIEPGLADALRRLGSTADAEDVLATWLAADCVMFPDTVQLARRASEAGIPVVLATNQEHRRASDLRARLNGHFPLTDLLYSADLGHPKPTAEFFELASARLGVAPDARSSIVFADDSEANVDAARRAGWRAVHAVAGNGWIGEVEALLGLDSTAG